VLPALGLAQVHHASHERKAPGPHRHSPRSLVVGAAHTRTVAALPALTSVMSTASARTMAAASLGTRVERVAASSASAGHRHTPRITALEQIRREFGNVSGRTASAGRPAHSRRSRSDPAARSVLAQVRREFGTPVARAASPALQPPSGGAPAGGAGSVAPPPAATTVSGRAATPASEPTATSTGAATPSAAAPTAVPSQPPKQTSAQAVQTQAEFGFEK
jgi:hypothetical protein